tara:strand:+ start:505 stop:999 length:495 start_codon:yes stop_codon:yes gene_type:complete
MAKKLYDSKKNSKEFKDISIDLTKKENFTHWTDVTLRFCDQDSLGHINNVAYGAFVEAARTSLIDGMFSQFKTKSINFVLARLIINFRQEMYYPGIVNIGALFTRIGSKSFTSHYGLFNDNLCVATAESTNVFFDLSTHESILPPKEIRDAIQSEIQKNPFSSF